MSIVPVSKRDTLIIELRNIINEQNGTKLTEEQVRHWVGSDSSEGKIEVWIEETYSLACPVTAYDVESLWRESSEIKVEDTKAIIDKMINPRIVEIESTTHYETEIGEEIELDKSTIDYSNIEESLEIYLCYSLLAYKTKDGKSFLIKADSQNN